MSSDPCGQKFPPVGVRTALARVGDSGRQRFETRAAYRTGCCIPLVVLGRDRSPPSWAVFSRICIAAGSRDFAGILLPPCPDRQRSFPSTRGGGLRAVGGQSIGTCRCPCLAVSSAAADSSTAAEGGLDAYPSREAAPPIICCSLLDG